MKKLRRLAIATFSVVIVCAGLGRVEAREPRVLLFIVDDLHLDFRSTPRLRELVKKVARLSTSPVHRVALVTTGSSSVAVGPTSDLQRIASRLSHISGEGLRADERVDPQLAAERIRRALTAITTARGAIRVVASRTKDPFVVLYFSSGYAEPSVAVELAELASDAYRANAAIYTFELWNVPAGEAQDSLHALANSTGGRMISTPGEFYSAMAEIAR